AAVAAGDRVEGRAIAGAGRGETGGPKCLWDGVPKGAWAGGGWRCTGGYGNQWGGEGWRGRWGVTGLPARRRSSGLPLPLEAPPRLGQRVVRGGRNAPRLLSGQRVPGPAREPQRRPPPGLAEQHMDRNPEGRAVTRDGVRDPSLQTVLGGRLTLRL